MCLEVELIPIRIRQNDARSDPDPDLARDPILNYAEKKWHQGGI